MFEHGSEWIRADFHLHTKSDREFKFKEPSDTFINKYVEKLEKEKIKLGAITNHNKFNLDEYKGLKKKARKKDITLLPGVELSVKEGANGIHCLVIFDDNEWVNNGKDNINQFLDEIFKGIDNRESENTRCNKDLLGVVDVLDTFNQNYFLIMAHVEQKSGFFEECDGGLIKTLSKNEKFKNSVLGFQKGRTRDKMKQIKELMGYKLPYIEGSDCKSIEEIGKGKPCYIKLGDEGFESLILAFKDFENRLSLNNKEISRGYIKSIEFKGGKLDSKKILLSNELNCLIGIRGSGKSSLIEVIRDSLNLTASDVDRSYKHNLIENLLGSGGQIILKLQNEFQKEYTIKKILREECNIYNSDGEYLDIKLDSILKTPLYFGQKDLSSSDDGFELKLLEKLMGEKNKTHEESINEINYHLKKAIEEYIKFQIDSQKSEDLESDLKGVQHQLEVFQEHQIDKKLAKQTDYQQDKNSIKIVKTKLQEYINKISDDVNNSKLDEINVGFVAKQTDFDFSRFNSLLNETKELKIDLETIIKKFNDVYVGIEQEAKLFEKHKKSLEEEFAEVKRTINVSEINPEEYEKLIEKKLTLQQEIDDKSKTDIKKQELKTRINKLIAERNDELLKIFHFYSTEIEKINSVQENLKVKIEFKGDKETFVSTLSNHLKGTGIAKKGYENLSEKYSDFTNIIKDILLDEGTILKEIVTDGQYTKVKERIYEIYQKLIDIHTPNLIEIYYHDRNIREHSLGQRASALVLFILAQKDNDLIIIDQPEDDLDNKVIYEEIIKEIKKNKENVQLIFATHNANIPVLGDAENLISFDYNNEGISFESGSIDKTIIQEEVVKIMEGGPEAFNKRKSIYNLWSINQS